MRVVLSVLHHIGSVVMLEAVTVVFEKRGGFFFFMERVGPFDVMMGHGGLYICIYRGFLLAVY